MTTDDFGAEDDFTDALPGWSQPVLVKNVPYVASLGAIFAV